MSKPPALPAPWKRALLWTVSGLGIAAVLLVGAWVLDEKVIHDGMVLRNVTLAGDPVGGFGPGDLERRLAVLADDVADDTLTIDLPERVITATNAGAGVSLDVAATGGQVMEAGREGNLVDQFRSWVDTLLGEPRPVDLVYDYQQDSLDAWLTDLPAARLREPVEPTFSGRSGQFVVQPGEDGQYLDADTVAAAAADAFTTQSSPFTVAVDWTPIPPQVTPEAVDEALAVAEDLADSALTVSVGEHVTRIGPGRIRRWIESEQDGDRLEPVFKPARVQRQLEQTLAEFADPGEDPTFSVVDGEVQVEYGIPPTRCCAPGVSALVYEAITSGGTDTLALPLVEVEDEKTQAAKLGIVEMVSEFTTNHNCCESRVDNIHRIADIVRGVVIHPGETFSINDYVGERTTEKGFVPAGTIQFGRFEDGVGGGISQFATTMFNAAFFAGMEFEEYQSHSLYIDRYPYGREATLSYPHPDLVMTNNTPYGVLLWPTYTDTSVTVQMWSTEYWDVEQSGQISYPVDQCTRVETSRRRTNPDGVSENDEVFALYRPGEGLDCAGAATPQPQ